MPRHEHTCRVGALASEEVETFLQLLLLSFKDANNIEQEMEFGILHPRPAATCKVQGLVATLLEVGECAKCLA